MTATALAETRSSPPARPSFLPAPGRSFLDVLAGHVERAPDRRAYTALGARGREMAPREFTLAELFGAARRAAEVLHDRCVSTGDRVILSIDRTEAFLSFFLGAQSLGAIPVPLPPLSTLEPPASYRDRIASVARDARPAVVVVDSDKARDRLLGVLETEVQIVTAAELEGAHEGGRAPFRTTASLDEVAMLQYTSGSTGRPKGVIVDHGNLVANFRAITLGAGFGPDEISVSWLPLYHDMGIIGGLLVGLYLHTHPVVMQPRAFLLRPESWLWAIHEMRATFTVAPNFAYNLVARKLSDAATAGLDLSSLRLAFDGAEPIDRRTIDAFVERFRPHGLRESAFYPVYGLAECTLAVAFPRPGETIHVDRVDRDSLVRDGHAVPASADGPDPVEYVSVGWPVPDQEIRIREVDGERELAERSVGEICVSGPSCTRGYWARPASTSGEVRTGDLGYVAEGRLYVIDRLKDLVILAGRNFAPSDIERAAASVDGISPGGVVAFAVRGDEGTDELCLVVTLQPTTWRTFEHIRHDIERAVHEQLGVVPKHVLPVRPGTLPKTSSGKLRRQECKLLWEDGQLTPAHGIAARAGIKVARLRQRLVRLVAERRESDFPPPVK